VTCGQSTLCYNLLDHLIARHGADDATWPEPARDVYGRARALWMRLQLDPEALLRDRLGVA